MKNLFEHTSSYWVRYSEYECRKAADGNEYVVPATGAKPEPFDPITSAPALALPSRVT